MTITVNTPDGGTASFPDDTDTATITSAMKAKFGGPAASGNASGYGDSDSVASEAGNTAYRAADTGTLGALDWGLAGVHKLERATGYDPNATDIDQIHQQNKDWQAAHPLLALSGDVAGYGFGLGKLGIAAKLGEGAAALGAGSKLAAGLGGAGEAAGLTAAGDIGHGEAPGMDVLYSGGLGGALGGALGGGGKAAPVGQSIADLQGARSAAFGAMDAAPAAVSDVKSIVADPISDLKPGQQAGITSGMKAQLDQTNKAVDDASSLSVGDVYGFRKSLNNAARSDEDKVLAKTVGDSLQDLSPDLMQQASLAHGRVKDAGWLSNPDISNASAVKKAQKSINNPQRVMDDPTQIAMQNLAGSQPELIRKGLANTAGFGVNTGVSTALGGGLGDTALGAILGYERGTGAGLGGIAKNAILNAGIKKARRQALAAVSGGAPAPTGTRRVLGALASGAGGLSSNLLNARAASGAFGGS